MKTVKIQYAGATIEICAFLADTWPHKMNPDQWPTFCGAGGGIGDKLVPDEICAVSVRHVCFDHDMGFAVGPDTREAFHSHNKRFYRNLLSVIVASDLQGKELVAATNACAGYFLAVESPLGWINFSPCGEDHEANPAVKEKLLRLQGVE